MHKKPHKTKTPTQVVALAQLPSLDDKSLARITGGGDVTPGMASGQRM